MKRSNKILLGAATFWPPLYIFLFLAFVIAIMVLSNGGPPGGPEDMLAGILFVVVFALHMLTIFGSLGLTVYYLIHAIKRKDLKDEMKAVWAVLFFFFGMFTQPVYWYLYIWKEPEPAAPTPEQLYAANTADWVRPEETRRQGEYAPPNEPPDWR
jgi:hypothetical protein